MKEDDWSEEWAPKKDTSVEDGWEIHPWGTLQPWELRDPEGWSKEYPLVIWDGIVLELKG